MKIAFICSCIEPGKDGIGDCARELAVALIRQGHQARLLGLAERFCSAEGEGAQESHGVAVPVLRLPETLPWAERIARARAWLDDFQPDWVSLQFVIYGYSRKGLPWRLAHRLGAVCAGRRVHLMMHETWVGFTRTATLQHRLLGWVQRHIILDLIRRLRPTVIHTSIPLYQIMLRQTGFAASLLPIPSSIPVVPAARGAFASELAALGISQENRASWRVLGIFGTLHPGHDYRPFIAGQVAAASDVGQRLALLTIGRTGQTARAILDDLAGRFPGQIFVHQFGERPAVQISGFFQNLDFGVAAAPRPFLGKSSAVAAMRLHGLKVLVPHEMILPEFTQALAESAARSTAINSPQEFSPPAVASVWLRDLSQL